MRTAEVERMGVATMMVLLNSVEAQQMLRDNHHLLVFVLASHTKWAASFSRARRF